MTQPDTFPVLPEKESKTEWKVKAAAAATYLAGLAASVFLATTATDYVKALPDALEAIVYPALLAAITLVSGRMARTKPDQLSPSTVEAVTKWLRNRMPARGL